MIGMLRRFETNYARAIGRHGNVPPVSFFSDRSDYPLIALIIMIGAILVPVDLLTSRTVLTATCAALLIAGLPHGALDLAVLRRNADHRIALTISLYLALSAVMFAAWQAAPSLALALFLAMAMMHFAEDWSDAEHPFFALGIAIALLSAPALFHHAAMGKLFVLLTGDANAAVLADTLLLVAPAAAACALLAILLLWLSGHRATAVNAACALVAMVMLPPIIGFAIYFCLIHSPSHFRAGMKGLAPATGVVRLTVFASLGGLGIALAIFQSLPIGDPSSRLFAASFMTLSVLTLPHMAVPQLLRRLASETRLPPR